jgi:hypothetical protein
MCAFDIQNAQVMNNFKANLFDPKPGQHRQKNIIWIRFPFERKLINHLKEHTTAKYSKTNTCWYVPDNLHYRKTFDLKPKLFSKNNNGLYRTHRLFQKKDHKSAG